MGLDCNNLLIISLEGYIKPNPYAFVPISPIFKWAISWGTKDIVLFLDFKVPII